MPSFHPAVFFDLQNYEHRDLFENCPHVWEALRNIRSYILAHKCGKITGHISPQAYIINPELISIGEGSVVEPGAYIEGPCIIGKNCQIRHGAYIRGNVITGNNCTIGHTTEVKNTIFLNSVRADHFAYIGDSILGNKAHLGAGVKLANVRLDSQKVIIKFEGCLYNTESKKLGAIIGDDAQLGCNSATNPGTLIGKGCHLFACTPFGGGMAPAYSEIRRDGKIIVTMRK